jgi:hypothetical protein
MHGGHLIKEIRLYQLQAWLKQLSAYHQCHAPARQEHQQAKPQIKRTYVLVVGCKQPAP